MAAIFSRSLSIISSVVDSAVDSASACVLFWVVRAIKKRDPYTYPGGKTLVYILSSINLYETITGRTRLEPVIIVILSVTMVSASVQVIYESIESLISDVDHFTKNSTVLRQIDMGPAPITVMCVTIRMCQSYIYYHMIYTIIFLVCKAILSFLCYQVTNPTMYAVAQDHQNDVFSNIVALACGIIGKQNKLSYPSLLSKFL